MTKQPVSSKDDDIFRRVVSILESARKNVIRSVNAEMVTAYWLIGREIVEELQAGETRAGYAKELLEELSAQLNEQFGKGFSSTNLRYFRVFYLAFPERNTSERRHEAF